MVAQAPSPLMTEAEFDAYVAAIGNAVAELRPGGVNGNDVCNGMATALGRFIGGLVPTGSDTIGICNEFARVMRHAARDANTVYPVM